MHSKSPEISPLWLVLIPEGRGGYVKVSKKERLFSGDSQPCDVPEDLGVAGRGAGCAPPLECSKRMDRIEET